MIILSYHIIPNQNNDIVNNEPLVSNSFIKKLIYSYKYNNHIKDKNKEYSLIEKKLHYFFARFNFFLFESESFLSYVLRKNPNFDINNLNYVNSYILDCINKNHNINIPNFKTNFSSHDLLIKIEKSSKDNNLTFTISTSFIENGEKVVAPTLNIFLSKLLLQLEMEEKNSQNGIKYILTNYEAKPILSAHESVEIIDYYNIHEFNIFTNVEQKSQELFISSLVGFIQINYENSLNSINQTSSLSLLSTYNNQSNSFLDFFKEKSLLSKLEKPQNQDSMSKQSTRRKI